MIALDEQREKQRCNRPSNGWGVGQSDDLQRILNDEF